MKLGIKSALPWRIIVGWGLGSTTLGATNFAKVLVLGYLVDYVGVAAGVAALIIAMSNIYDAVVDPLIGTASDRTRSSWGRRIPFMFFGALLLAFAWALMFNVPARLTGGSVLAYVAFALIIFSTGYGMFGVPYNAMPSELTEDYHSRTLMMSARSVFSTLGTSSGGFLAPYLITHFGGGRAGHAGMSWVLGAMVLAFGLICILMIGRQPNVEEVATRRPPFRAQIGSMLANRHFFVLLIAHAVGMTGVMMMNGSAVFYVRRVLGGGDAWLGRFFLYLNVMMFLSLPLCLWLGRKLGKRDAFIIGSLMVSAASFSWYWARLDEPYLIFMFRNAALSFGSATMIVLGYAMLPDAIEYDCRRTGLRREGLYAGFWTTVEKGSAAAGISIVGLILSLSGYAQSHGDAVKQTPQALFGVYLAFGVGPGVTILISAMLMLLYGLDEQTLKNAPPLPFGDDEPVAVTMPPAPELGHAH